MLALDEYVGIPPSDFAFDWRGDWRRMLAHELCGLPTLRADRRRATAAMALPRIG